MGPRDHFYPYLYHCDYIGLLGIGFMQVFHLGRAPRTKETLPDFLKWHRVTRIPRFGASTNPRVWGVTAWYQRLGIRIPRELGFGYPSPLGGLMWSIGIWKSID